jgi:chemotaxis protein histidine kinase CheA
MVTNEDIQLISDFCQEIEELLNNLEKNLQTIENFIFKQPYNYRDYISFMEKRDTPKYLEALKGINRFVHTLKGVSSFMNLQRINRYCHCVEEITIDLTEGRIVMDMRIYALIENIPIIITRFTEKLKKEYTDENVSIDAELEKITQLRQTMLNQINGDKIQLASIQSVDLGIVRNSSKNIKMTINLNVHDEIVQNFQSIIHNTIGMLQNSQIPKDVISDVYNNLNDHLEKLILSAQSKFVFSRYQRIIMDLGNSLGKKIDFIVKRNDALARPDVWDKCHNALVHLVRNAVDHGIELPEQRKALNKPETGTIHFEIYEDHKNIYIVLTDDGAGLDPEKIGSKALQKGIVTQLQLQSLTREEIQKLIFHHGFSTKEKATDISGRGVGMDAVIKEIQGNLNGILHLKSQLNIGTEFFIEIPKSETLTECIIFGDNKYTYAIPKISEVEYLDGDPKYIQTTLGKHRFFVNENLTLPLLDVLELLHPAEYNNHHLANYSIIKITNNFPMGLIVPEVFGHRRIKIERSKELRRIMGDKGVVYGYGLTEPPTIILELDFLESVINRVGEFH